MLNLLPGQVELFGTLLRLLETDRKASIYGVRASSI